MSPEQTLALLNTHEFHDLPVEKIELFGNDGLQIEFEVLFFNESTINYDRQMLAFSGITELQMDDLLLVPDEDTEIYSFDYSYDGAYKCRLVLHTGFERRSVEIRLKCGGISLHK